jgi:hypothetical protein
MEAVVMTGAYLSRERVGMGGKPIARVFVETLPAPVTTALDTTTTQSGVPPDASARRKHARWKSIAAAARG